MKDDNRWKQPTCSWSNFHGSSINVVLWRSLFHRQTHISQHLLEVLQGAPPKRLCVFKAWPVSKVEISSKEKEFCQTLSSFSCQTTPFADIHPENERLEPEKTPKRKRRNIDTPQTSNFCWGVWFYPFFFKDVFWVTTTWLDVLLVLGSRKLRDRCLHTCGGTNRQGKIFLGSTGGMKEDNIRIIWRIVRFHPKHKKNGCFGDLLLSSKFKLDKLIVHSMSQWKFIHVDENVIKSSTSSVRKAISHFWSSLLVICGWSWFAMICLYWICLQIQGTPPKKIIQTCLQTLRWLGR